MGFALRSPGSWLGGSWVSVTLVFFVVFAASSRSCSDVLGTCLLFARSNSSAHKLLNLTRALCPTTVISLLVFALVCWCFFVCFVLFPWVVTITHGQLGLRIGPCSLLIPQRGNDARCCTIRSTGTNTALRPGESRERTEKKTNTTLMASNRGNWISGENSQKQNDHAPTVNPITLVERIQDPTQGQRPLVPRDKEESGNGIQTILAQGRATRSVNEQQ